jgi:glycosyltransferase involved in cell wall biosynthesis
MGKQPAIYARAFQTALRRFRRSRKSATFKHLLQAGYLVQHLLPGLGIKHLHAHFVHSPTSVALFASQFSGLSFSFTGHAKDIYTSDPRQLAEKIDLARFAVTCTEHNKQYLRRISPGTTTPIYRIYHGIEIDLFSRDTHQNKGLKNSPPYNILTVARITPKKGLDTVYRAIRLLCDQGFAVNHTLIGDGEDRATILSLIRDLGLNQVTRWLGTQPHDVVLEHYRQSDLFVLACEIAPNGDRDGIPNVLIESMAVGVPVVATNVSAIPELVEDEENGLLVPPGEPEQLALAMTRLLEDEDLRKRVIPAAKKRVVREFDNRALTKNLAAVYRKEIEAFREL